MTDEPFDRGAERQVVALRIASSSPRSREGIIDEYARRSEAAFSPETLRNYRQICRMFEQWCSSMGYRSTPPVSPSIVAQYVDFLGGRVKPSTIEVRLWAIGEMHLRMLHPSPCRNRLVNLALKAVKRTYGAAVRQAPALGKTEIIATIESLGGSRIDVRDKAVLWIATDSWCRASELCAFKVKDLELQADGSSLLYVSRSKTDPYGAGAYAFLSSDGTQAVLDWIKLAGLRRDDPIVTKSQVGAKRTPLDPATISRIFKRCTGRPDVSAHSTRVGGVQDAFRIGCDLSSIMVAGRWSSPEMPARYGRRILASQSAAAKVSEAFGRSRAT